MGIWPSGAYHRRAQGSELPSSGAQLQAAQADREAVVEGAGEVNHLPGASGATATGGESGDFDARTTGHVDTLGSR